MKVAFVDRDGTISKEHKDEDWRYIREPELIEGSIRALTEMKNKGYEIIIITNQPFINDGIITLRQYNEFSDKLKKVLNNYGIYVLEVFYCPHSLTENCNCRKPKTGLVDMAIKKYKEIDLDNSFIVGDSWCDVELGDSLGIKTFGIKVEMKNIKYTKINSLFDIIEYI